jgi:hypothetical protein
MQLPSKADKFSKGFTGLSEARKTEIISHLALVPDGQGPAAIKTMIANGGPEAEFVAGLFDQPLPGKKDAPQNKAATPPSSL